LSPRLRRFDAQFRFGAVEVSNEPEDGMLATDFEAELPVAHARPDFGFRGREWVPKVARALENRGIDSDPSTLLRSAQDTPSGEEVGGEVNPE
jgi:hypothetical protein